MSTAAVEAPRLPPSRPVESSPARDEYWAIERFFREGPAPLLDPIPGMADKPRLHLAFVVPPFGIGSGGHATIFRLLHLLEQRGHTCSIWVHDPAGERDNEWPAVMRRVVVEHFSPVAAPLHKGFDDWRGADVVIATGWQTVYPAMLLPGVRARSYLINDHESEFYPTSVESQWAEQTYRLGMHGICASPWLRDIYVERYGGSAGYFELGVDHDVYMPRPIERRRDTVVFYCRPPTGRRAFALGRMALAELKERHPDLRIVAYGAREQVPMAFAYEHAGIASPVELSWLYSQATVGLSLSMTNYSLIPQEMLACGLPCVDLQHPSTEGVFGNDGPVSLAPFRPNAIADAIDELLRDDELWERRSRAGIEFVAEKSWEHVADVVEDELRHALRLRETGAEGVPSLELGLEPGPQGAEVRKARQWGRRRVPEHLDTHQVTDTLFERLTPDDVAAVEAAADDQQRALLHGAHSAHRRVLTLAFGVHHRVPAVLARTGLSPATPPADVHAMARGADSAGGGYWYADLIAEEVTLAGQDITALDAALDFGCSSGRVVRVLAAAYPQVHWQGCDPNAAAICWASSELTGAEFFVSPQDPPLPLADSTLDLAFAISVWSHYGAGSAIRWLAEMYRVLKPGGLLLLTTHGPLAIDFYRRTGQRGTEQLDAIERALARDGFWFRDEFGRGGDWGVKHTEWGTAFLSPEWLLTQLGDAWELVRFGPGKIEGNQDVYVLRRR